MCRPGCVAVGPVQPGGTSPRGRAQIRMDGAARGGYHFQDTAALAHGPGAAGALPGRGPPRRGAPCGTARAGCGRLPGGRYAPVGPGDRRSQGIEGIGARRGPADPRSGVARAELRPAVQGAPPGCAPGLQPLLARRIPGGALAERGGAGLCGTGYHLGRFDEFGILVRGRAGATRVRPSSHRTSGSDWPRAHPVGCDGVQAGLGDYTAELRPEKPTVREEDESLQRCGCLGVLGALAQGPRHHDKRGAAAEAVSPTADGDRAGLCGHRAVPHGVVQPGALPRGGLGARGAPRGRHIRVPGFQCCPVPWPRSSEARCASIRRGDVHVVEVQAAAGT